MSRHYAAVVLQTDHPRIPRTVTVEEQPDHRWAVTVEVSDPLFGILPVFHREFAPDDPALVLLIEVLNRDQMVWRSHS